MNRLRIQHQPPGEGEAPAEPTLECSLPTNQRWAHPKCPMSNEQCAMCNTCRLLNDLDFPLLIAHCSLFISGARFRGSMRERYFRRIVSMNLPIANCQLPIANCLEGRGSWPQLTS